jgi:two-component system KDP operon response regulator KdpE
MDAMMLVSLQQQTAALRAACVLLVVEDDPETLKAYAMHLRRDKYTVHTAEGYQTALDIAKTVRVDCAVCDINLWDGDGCDLLQELQKLQPLKGVAVTGYTLPDETEHSRDAGFGVILSKPVNPLRITSAIAELG